MQTESLTHDLRSINPIKVRDYLYNKGWKLADSTESSVYLHFLHPSDDYAQLDLPFEVELRGFVRAIEEVVCRLSEFESRSQDAVISDLLHPGSYVISGFDDFAILDECLANDSSTLTVIVDRRVIEN